MAARGAASAYAATSASKSGVRIGTFTAAD